MSVWNRRAAALLLAAAVWIGCAPVAAADPAVPAYGDSGDASHHMALPPEYWPGGGITGEAPDPTEILGPQMLALLTLPKGAQPELPQTVPCKTDGAGGAVECPVEWYESMLDGTQTGRVLLPGKLTAPEGYHFAASGPNTVQPDFVALPLFFYGEGTAPEPLRYIDVPFLQSAQYEEVYRLGVGGDPRTLPFWNIEVECLTQDGDSLTLPVRWDTSGLDTRRPGRYTLPGSVGLPPCFTIPENFTPLAMEVEVGDSRPVTLVNPRLESGNVVCAVNGQIVSVEWLCAEILKNLPDESWRYCYAQPDDMNGLRGRFITYGGGFLTVLGDKLDAGMSYSFRLRYQGAYSNVLHVRVPEDGAPEFSLERESSDAPSPKDPFDDPSSGDHGGGDRHDQKLPPLRQQTPDRDGGGSLLSDRGAKPGGPTSRPPALAEESTETGVRLSGERLERLAAPQETVLFEKQGVAAELPSDYLRSIKLADGSLLEVTVEPVGKNGFRLMIAAGGEAVGELPPTLVRLPLAGIPEEGMPLACYDVQGNYICDAWWDPALGVVTVEITRPGEYVVREKDPPEAVPTAAPINAPPAPLVPVPNPKGDMLGFPPLLAAAMPAVGVGGWLLWRRRRGRKIHE